MGQGEVCREIGPILVGVVLAILGFAIFQEHAGCKEDLKGGGNNLGGGIGRIYGGGKGEGVFDLVKEAFDRLIGIVGGLEDNIVVLEVSCGDASVLGV